VRRAPRNLKIVMLRDGQDRATAGIEMRPEAAPGTGEGAGDLAGYKDGGAQWVVDLG